MENTNKHQKFFFLKFFLETKRRLKECIFTWLYLISKSTGSVRNWTSKGIFWRLCASSFTWCQKGQFEHACPFIHAAHKFAVTKSWSLTEFKVLLARNLKICIWILSLTFDLRPTGVIWHSNSSSSDNWTSEIFKE